MSLGLGTSLSKGGLATPSIVTDSLVLKHNYAAGGVVPVSDGAVFLDGTDDYISITADTISVDDTAFSCVFWANRKTVSDWDVVLGNDSGSITTYSWVALDTDGDRLLLESLTDNNKLTGAISMVANRWYHFAICVGTDGTGQIYQDGVAVTTTGTLTNDFTFGRIGNAGGSNDFIGYLCNLAYWEGTTLTQAQVKSIMWKNYAGLTSTETTNLVSWWNLDEETATDGTAGSGGVKDSHGSNHGELKP